jgi:hypothetical protein
MHFILTLCGAILHGFRRRMLAVRPVEGVPSAKLFRLHLYWMFTLMGLTVPFRIWFARHCDELRVTVAKETSTENKKPSSSWSWRSKSTPDPSTEYNEHFKAKMRELALYTQGKPLQSNNETESYDVLGVTKGKSPDSSAKQDADNTDYSEQFAASSDFEALKTKLKREIDDRQQDKEIKFDEQFAASRATRNLSINERLRTVYCGAVQPTIGCACSYQLWSFMWPIILPRVRNVIATHFNT